MHPSDRPTPTPVPPRPFDDRPRAITPPRAWDTRPKLPSESHEDLPVIPKGPRTASGFGDIDRVIRDTERTGFETFEEEETTPAESPLSKRVMKRLDKFEKQLDTMAVHCSTAADTSLAVLAAMSAVTKDVAELKRRMTAVELSEKWVPRLAWMFTTLIALFALFRTYR